MTKFDDRGREVETAKDVEVTELPPTESHTIESALSFILAELKIMNAYNAIGYNQEIKEIDTED